MTVFLIAYSKTAFALSLMAFGGLAVWGVARSFPRLFRCRGLLRLQWTLLAAAFVVPLLPSFQGSAFQFEAPLKVWTGASYRGLGEATSMRTETPVVTLNRDMTIPSDLSGWILAFAVLGLAGWWAKKVWRLYSFSRAAIRLRRIGRVELLVSDDVEGPFSFWLPGRAVVVVPSWILERPQQFRIAVRHELQHHRARDPQSAYVLSLVNALFFWNPMPRLWDRAFQELQEMACDEALVGRRGFSRADYIGCLFEVAQRSLERPRHLVGTPGFAWFVSRGHLKRRLERMKLNTGINQRIQRWALAGIAVFGLGTAVLGAYASQAVVRDSRITLRQAEDMADSVSRDTDFPIVVNERVVEQLNRYLSTPDGREFIRASLERMQAMRPMLERKAKDYGAPLELLAVPIVESGYRNLSERGNRVRSAGIWQFIPQTARNYGMRVDDTIDERLNVDKQTSGAFRYLGSSKLRFEDWLLALIAYNWGENNVQDAIEETGSRDAFVLSEKANKGDPNYLAKVMAAVLILKNPALL